MGNTWVYNLTTGDCTVESIVADSTVESGLCNTLHNAGGGLGDFIGFITDPYVVLIIGIGIAMGVGLLFSGITNQLKRRL